MNKSKRKTVTMSDIAQALNISKNAVSLALTNKPGVSDELRAEILKTAERMRYGAPSPVISRHHPCIVVVVPEYIRNDSYFYSDVFWSIEHEARKIGYPTLTAGVSALAERDGTMPMLPENLPVLGYLAIGIISEDYLQKLCALGGPVVAVDIQPRSVPVSSVGSSNLHGGFLATDYLIQKGHRRIGFAGPIYAAQSVYERWCGYLQALMRAQIPVRTDFAIFGEKDQFELLNSTDALSPHVEAMGELPEAWFCAGDLIAVSMIRLLTERGLRVPEDVSVIGFDDLQIAQMLTPTLTTIRVNRKLMGKTAVWHLIDHVQGSRPSGGAHIALHCHLVERDSVCDR